MKQIAHFFLLLFLISLSSYAQKSGIKGIVTDAVTSEPLIGASISAGGTKAVATDIDGNYFLNLEDGEYTISISFIGYTPLEKKITIKVFVLLM